MAKKLAPYQYKFEAIADIKIKVTVPVAGGSLLEAVENANALTIEDFITFKGEQWGDGEVKVSGVYSTED